MMAIVIELRRGRHRRSAKRLREMNALSETDLTEAQRIAFNRIIWHSRRGMLELDILLEPFVKKRYLQLDEDAQRAYRQLLDCEDQQLFDWLLNKREPRPELAAIVADILHFAAAAAP